MKMELWLPITGYEGLYEVSNLGHVRSIPRPIQQEGYTRIMPGKLLTPWLAGAGYHMVHLSRDNIQRKHYIHRLVASEFIRPPLVGEEINHLDGDKINNADHNLEWTDRSGNNLHSYRSLGRMPPKREPLRGEQHPLAKLSMAQVKSIREFTGRKTLRELSAMFGVSSAQISRVQRYLRWR